MSGELPAAGVGPTYVEMIQKMGNLQDITNKVNVIAEQNSQASTEILKRIGIIRERITNLSELWKEKSDRISQLQEDHETNIKNLKSDHDAALAKASTQGTASSKELAALKQAIREADEQYTDKSETLMKSIEETLNYGDILSQMNKLYEDVNALSLAVGSTELPDVATILQKSESDEEDDDDEGKGGLPGTTPGDQRINYESDTGSVSSMSTTGSKKKSPQEIQADVDDLKRRGKEMVEKRKANEAQVKAAAQPAAATRAKSTRPAAASGQKPGAFRGKGGSRKKRRRSSKKRHHITRRKHHSKKKHGGRKSLKKHKKDHKKKRPIKRVTFKKHH
jgi:hypothetical protein